MPAVDKENQRLGAGDGGQRGCADTLKNQSGGLSNSGKDRIENIDEFGAETNRILVAAQWLQQHRAGLTRPVIPTLRDRFRLTNLEAIEATKKAHSLAYSGA